MIDCSPQLFKPELGSKITELIATAFELNERILFDYYRSV